MFPGLPLPPQPIVTRWGTWLQAAIYYADNYNQVAQFLDAMDADDAKSIRKAKNMIAKPNLATDLSFIKNNFAVIVTNISKLQAQGLPLADSIQLFDEVGVQLKAIRSQPKFWNKYNRVIARNPGHTQIRQIARVLSSGTIQQMESLDAVVQSYIPAEHCAFKYAPITSSDVERSFSRYNHVLEDNRRSFSFDNLKMHVIVLCNTFDS